MDVSCPSCKSEYELDDARVPPEGVTVKCASCQYVFKVKRPEAKAPSRTTQSEGSVASASGLPPAPPSREWKVRQASGNVYTCRELTTLQKWIIEGKVVRDDEISLSGDAWKRLGNIPELASFFQVVEDAARARSYDALKSVQANQPAFASAPSPLPRPVTQERQEPVMAQPPPPPPPSMPGPTETFQGAQFPPMREPAPQPRPATETLQGARFADDTEATDPEGPPRKPQRPPSGQYRPSPSRARMQAELEQEDFEDSLRAAGVKKSGKGGWILLLIAGLGLGGGLGYYFGWYLPEQQAKEAEKQLAEKNAAGEAKKREEEARAQAEAQKTVVPPLVVDAGALAVVDAGAPAVLAVVDAGQPVVDAGTPKAPAKVAEPVRDYDWYMARADRLREAEKSEAALDMYGRAADIHPDRAEPLAGKGLALLDLGRAAAAQAALEQAIAINRSYGPAIMGLAEAYRATGSTDKAIQYYQRYLDVLPNGPEAAVARNQLERLKK